LSAFIRSKNRDTLHFKALFGRRMMNNAFRWNDWNEDHISGHGVRPSEAEFVVDHASPPYPESIGRDKWLVRGQAPDGRYLQVIFIIEDDCYYVIHARGLTDTEKRRLRRRRR
jgi:uncharacterized DUF497 family protein